ncbi:MAG TPA: RHS repeat-associated core domain-containing protein [Mycobacteriales bacterium]|nr:RHS repeat-associated core domain-containing protein [Mycobacteriales bacterium]
MPTTYRWDINNPLPLLATERTGTGRPQVYRYDPTGQPLSLLPGRRISPIPTPSRDGGAAAAPDRPAGPPISPGLARSYYATDWLGSVTDITGAGGTPTYAYTYQPFGETSTAAAVGAATNPLRFAGQYLDPVTGQYNLRARQYDPATGRLTSTDPLTPDTGTPAASSYAYTANRPTITTDPSGECWYIPFSGDSSCPGAGTLRATVGVAEGAYHVGAGIVTAVAHPPSARHTPSTTPAAPASTTTAASSAPASPAPTPSSANPSSTSWSSPPPPAPAPPTASTTSPKPSSPSPSSAKPPAPASAPAPPPTPTTRATPQTVGS